MLDPDALIDLRHDVSWQAELEFHARQRRCGRFVTGTAGFRTFFFLILVAIVTALIVGWTQRIVIFAVVVVVR